VRFDPTTPGGHDSLPTPATGAADTAGSSRGGGSVGSSRGGAAPDSSLSGGPAGSCREAGVNTRPLFGSTEALSVGQGVAFKDCVRGD
jgi:hypothetical protein